MAKAAVVHKKVGMFGTCPVGEYWPTTCGIRSRAVRKFWSDVTCKRCRARKGKR